MLQIFLSLFALVALSSADLSTYNPPSSFVSGGGSGFSGGGGNGGIINGGFVDGGSSGGFISGGNQGGFQSGGSSGGFVSGGSSGGFISGSNFGASSGSFGSSGNFAGSGLGSFSADGCGPGEVRKADGTCAKAQITRNIFLFAAPPAQRIQVGPPPQLPEPKVHYNFVFVRTPELLGGVKPVVVPPPQQKTLVYVLTKRPGAQDQEVIEVPSTPTQPEVFFVNYAPGDNPQLPGGIDLQQALSQSVQQGRFIDGGEGSANLGDAGIAITSIGGGNAGSSFISSGNSGGFIDGGNDIGFVSSGGDASSGIISGGSVPTISNKYSTQ